MGRHSSEEQFRFYQSVAGWFLPWALVGVVAVAAMWIALDALRRDELGVRPPAGASAPGGAGPRTSPTPSPAPASPTPSPQPTPSANTGGAGPSEGNEPPEPTEPKEPKGQPRRPLITEGVTVQVLNGSSSPAAGNDMATRLARLGFEVVVVYPAPPYQKTTVLWSTPQARRAAVALAQRFGWASGPKPANLSSAVDLHVVVGADEA